MKRFFLVTLFLVMLFSIAHADGVWHYCDLCGRDHSGTICPEQCIDECTQNQWGNIHKWYDCPEYKVTKCWNCGQQTTDHNENCCPKGDTIWNDIKGVFKTKAFLHEDGARSPIYCAYCEHYGYHYSTECKKVPVTPAPTKTPKPTARPTAKPTKTPVPTATPHVHTKVKVNSEPEIRWVYSKENCYETTVYTTEYCNTCGMVFKNTPTVNVFKHTYGKDNVCDNCGYEKVCNHKNAEEQYYGITELEYIKTYNHCLIEVHTYKLCCEDCKTIVRTWEVKNEVGHNFNDYVCSNCGFALPKPTKTPYKAPTAVPTATPMVTWVPNPTATPTPYATWAPIPTIAPIIEVTEAPTATPVTIYVEIPQTQNAEPMVSLRTVIAIVVILVILFVVCLKHKWK